MRQIFMFAFGLMSGLTALAAQAEPLTVKRNGNQVMVSLQSTASDSCWRPEIVGPKSPVEIGGAAVLNFAWRHTGAQFCAQNIQNHQFDGTATIPPGGKVVIAFVHYIKGTNDEVSGDAAPIP